jgi:4-hydroxymandelate oxidase
MPINLFEYQEQARNLLPKKEYDFVAQGATDEITVHRARAAFDSILLRQRVLSDVSTRDMSTTVLGRRVECPIMIGPAGFHTRVTPDGELATARAAHAQGTIIVLSSSSSHTLEDVGAETPGAKWFQQYLYKDRELTLRMTARAEKSGYDAVCITLDFPPIPPKRERSIRNKYSQQPSPNYDGLNVPRYDYGLGHDAMRGVGELIDHSASWDDLRWFVDKAPLPIVAKGILTAEDGRAAADAGVRGIVVSAHGGRQLDTTVTSIEALPEVVTAVDGRAEIFLDSGIRRGTDVFKALALGARAVLFGRPLFWGLAVDGEAGLVDVIQILRDELELTMALCGHKELSTIDSSSICLSSPLLSALGPITSPETDPNGSRRF